MASLTVRRGDDHTIRGAVTATDFQTGEVAPVDITNWHIWFLIKRRRTDTDDQAVVKKITGLEGTEIDMAEASGGKFAIIIRASDLAGIPNQERTVMRYDVQVRTVPNQRIQTLGDGEMVILGDITFAIS